MAGRIRSIKPELLDDEVAAGLSDAAWRLWVSSWVLADDHGNLRAGAKYLAAMVWQDTGRNVDDTIEELLSKGRWIPYAVKGQRYAHIHAFDKHQRVDNAGKPRVPRVEEDDGTWDQSLTAILAESSATSGVDTQGRGSRVAGARNLAARPPTSDLRPPTPEGDPPQAAGSTAPFADSAKRKPHRLPEDWRPSERVLAKYAAIGIDATASVSRFRNHWLDAATKGALKLAWDRAFDSWVETDVERGMARKLAHTNGAASTGVTRQIVNGQIVNLDGSPVDE